MGKLAITIEIGEGMRIDWKYFNAGIRLVESFLKFAGMVGKRKIRTRLVYPEDLEEIYEKKVDYSYRETIF